jgi:hypothetical protein
LYEKAKSAGKLDSISIFGGASLPWTNKQVAELNNSLKKPTKTGTETYIHIFPPFNYRKVTCLILCHILGTEAGAAAKPLTPAEKEALRKSLAKISFKEEEAKKKASVTASTDVKVEKKRFGFF